VVGEAGFGAKRLQRKEGQQPPKSTELDFSYYSYCTNGFTTIPYKKRQYFLGTASLS
jgi:hypothetical protein